ncbi:MAG: exodeoxyribonuclease VII large subunit [Alphaproteobacteria bacterium]|jgi:exodeoxyribonuclease VII large subunit|nr:exodeoxyribonuclease VII large subunit [Alphaproteobacteria bacterium]
MEDSFLPLVPETDTAPKATRSNIPEYTVSEIGDALKKTIEGAYAYVRIRGEISQPKLHGSGHLYLRLKDDQAVIEAVCWRGVASHLSIKPTEGMEVICSGRLTTFKGRSQYQLIIEKMELAGLGALMKMLEDLKRKLAEEGLFDPAHKQKIPFLPKSIGVITSPTGAVIRDILHRLKDRFPRDVLVWPVAVQGEGSAAQIVSAIQGFDQFDGVNSPKKPDLLIVARGGGSFEDLMPFNDERVIRAIYACSIPVISAIGHETDTTLCDFVADLRAPTPTAAAEMSVPVRMDLYQGLISLKGRMAHLLAQYLHVRSVKLESLGRGLVHPRQILENYAQRLDDRTQRLNMALSMFLRHKRFDFDQMRKRLKHPAERITLSKEKLETLSGNLQRSFQQFLERKRYSFQSLRSMLESYSFARTLERGFVLMTDKKGHLVSKTTDIKAAESYLVTFQDGVLPFQSSSTLEKKTEKKKPESPSDQGLFDF